jgi:sugar phosphate isomerase/epimerase
MQLTRRDLGKLALAALPAAKLLAKANSKWGGVQIGINAPYSFHNMPPGADDVLKYLDQLGLNAVELRTQPVESFLDAPVVPLAPGRGKPPLTPDEQAARKAAMVALNKWRTSLSIDKMKSFRKHYNDAGVLIEVVKVDGINTFPDDVVDYCFTLAKTLGAKALSCEIPLSETKRLGEFAAKHKLMVGYHGHTNVTSPEAFGRPESWETAMSYSKYNGINLDIGHFLAGNNVSPIEFIKKHHDRITHIHIKDRKPNNGPNFPFGQGETPIKEVLQLMKTEKYPFQGTIEFEYPVPAGSDVLTEIAKCVEYCKNALV